MAGATTVRNFASRLLARPAPTLTVVCLALHLVANRGYDVFRDELYFIVCGQHPALGYVDQPPLVPLLAAASHALFGAALTPLRLAPALAMSATVALTAMLAKRLGGGFFAQWLSGLAVLLGPIFLVDGLLMSADMAQPLTWLACSWCLTRLAETRDERWWLPFGAVVGVSYESKYLIGFYLVGLGFGVLATPMRRSLTRPWLYTGAAIALAISAPNLIWQATHGWPFLEVAAAGAAGKNVALSPLAFLREQVLFVGPLAAPLWIAGLWRLAVRPPRPELRAFPIAYAVMTAIFLVTHGKPYYLAPIYPTLLAAGAVAIESWLANRALRGLALGSLLAEGLALAPLALPLLPPEIFVRYQNALGLGPAAMERGAQSVLPQHFADMFGWRNMATEVSAVYRRLPEAERSRAVFFGRNYGEAAALDVYGPALGGPPAISSHNAYYMWGPRGFDGSIVIVAGGDPARLATMFGSVEIAGRIDSRYAMPDETDIPIYLLRAPTAPLETLWPRLKHYN